ncbi:MAG: oligosaccharide flippase family protein [Flavobacteriales bacterium]|nr:oligosaccharide flippase family protein [Flavobacteriales bacterium]
MTGLQKFLKQRPLVRHLLVSLSGTLVAQLILLAAQPLLRRLYAPEHFGELSLYLSLTGVLATVAPFRYELALMIPASQDKALKIFWGATLLNTFFSLCITLLALLAAEPLIDLMRLPSTATLWLPWVGPSVWLYGMFMLFQNLFSRSQSYQRVNALRIGRRIPEIIFQWGAAGRLNLGLVAGEIAGRISMTALGFYFLLKSHPGSIHLLRNARKWLLPLLAFRQYPLRSFFPTFLNALALLAPSLIVNYHFGSYANGLFDMCLQVLALPAGFVINAISNVLLAEISQRHRQSRPLFGFLKRTATGLMGLALLMALGIALLGTSGFQFLFGSEYGLSYAYAIWLIPAIGSRLVVAPLAVFFAGTHQIGRSVWWQYTYAAGILTFFIIPFVHIHQFLAAYACFEVILNVLYLWQIFWLAKKSN